MKKLRLVLADDHALVRAGIRLLIEKLPNVEVVGEAGNGLDALELIRITVPDIAMVDLRMRHLNGLSVAERSAMEFPGVKVVVLSIDRDEEFVMHAFRVGAASYVVKDTATAELSAAINAAASGNAYVSPMVSGTLIASSLGRVTPTQRQEALTSRQHEVLRLIVEGRTMKEIAASLDLSIKTVEAHRAQITERLGIRDVPGLVRYAMRIGLVPSERPPTS